MRTVKLGDVAKWINGVSFSPSEKVEPFSEDSVVCFTTKNVQRDLDDSSVVAIPTKTVKRKEQIVQEGDVLVSTANSWNLVGKCCWVPKLKYQATLGAFISLLRPNKEEIFPKYFYYWMSSSNTQALLRNMGRKTTNISNMDKNRALTLKVPLPPLPEQKRIAAQLAQADRLRQLRRNASQLGESYLQSAFLAMFGDPVKNEKGWKTSTLNNVCDEITVGYVGPMAKEYIVDGIPFLRSLNVKPYKIDLKNIKYVSPDFHERLKKSALSPGDVVVVRTGNAGTAAIIPVNIPIANCADLVILRPSKKINNLYLTTLFNSSWGQGHVSGNVVGQIQQHFNVGAAKKMVIPLPPLPEQERFAQIVARYEKLRSQMRESTRQAEMLFQGLLWESFGKEM